jgi:signal transduction histidine kinase
MDRDLAGRIVLAADADRQELERELHDGPQQDLVALVVNVQIARRQSIGDPALLDEIAGDAQRALDALRRLAARISPPLAGAAGLAAALRAAADDPVEIDVDLSDACPPEIVRAAYFCCVALHGTSVTVRDDESALVFEVAGVDMDVANVRDRVEALGGELALAHDRVGGRLPFSAG